MRLIYRSLLYLAVPLVLLRLFVRGLSDREQWRRWRERFAYKLPASTTLPRRGIWIHAVSVGETVAAVPLVEYLKRHHPDTPILVTTTTRTGAATVASRFGSDVAHLYFPYDLPSVVERFLAKLAPRLLILMETELWPHLIERCAERNIPIMIANARMSHKSSIRYARFKRFTAEMLEKIDCIAVQTQADAERFLALGARSQSLIRTGSLKFDIAMPHSISESGQALRRQLGSNRSVLMAGSTRQGEEALILDAYTELLEQHADLLLLLAPRHPERFKEVAEICRKRKLEVIRYSEGKPCRAQTRVFLIDSMGELPSFYAASDIAFVGGSLVPRGGHNVLEPAALGVPVIVGPHTFNFADITARLADAGALLIVEDVNDFVAKAANLLADGAARNRAGEAGQKIVEQNRGAAPQVFGLVENLLGGRESVH